MAATDNQLLALIAQAQANAKAQAEAAAAARAAGTNAHAPAMSPDQYNAYMQQARAHTAAINNMPHVLDPNSLVGKSPAEIKALMYPQSSGVMPGSVSALLSGAMAPGQGNVGSLGVGGGAGAPPVSLDNLGMTYSPGGPSAYTGFNVPN